MFRESKLKIYKENCDKEKLINQNALMKGVFEDIKKENYCKSEIMVLISETLEELKAIEERAESLKVLFEDQEV